MSNSNARDLWRKKLEMLQADEAIAVDTAAKFKIQQDIQEARDKLRELDGAASSKAAQSTTATDAAPSRGKQPSTRLVAPSKLRHAADRLVGRDSALARLDAAWDDPHRHVQVIRAWGGVGKTALVAAWMDRLAADDWRGAAHVFDWSFYSQGTRSDTWGKLPACLFQ